MTDIQFVTQPTPEHVRTAADLLEAVLLNDLDTEARLAVAACLLQLLDVHPPYPPSAPITEPVPTGEGITRVRAELKAAAAEATGVQDRVRIGLAARELR